MLVVKSVSGETVVGSRSPVELILDPPNKPGFGGSKLEVSGSTPVAFLGYGKPDGEPVDTLGCVWVNRETHDCSLGWCSVLEKLRRLPVPSEFNEPNMFCMEEGVIVEVNLALGSMKSVF